MLDGVMSAMQLGTVKWFNPTRGFGYITPLDGSADVFVHFTAIVSEGNRELVEGQQVQFEVVESPRGVRAQSVRTVD